MKHSTIPVRSPFHHSIPLNVDTHFTATLTRGFQLEQW